MSCDRCYLAIRLEGPLQSWGFDSQYNLRTTGLMPTKSAIAGMCCAALGIRRGSSKEQTFLSSFTAVQMTAIAIPRKGANRELVVRRLQDFHTVQNTQKASGDIKDCHITHRQYLTDASFGVLLEGEAAYLKVTADALRDPVWGLWLGRKTCIPSAPVFAGLADTRLTALRLLIGNNPIEAYTRQEEVAAFSEGRDSLPDSPLSFSLGNRMFSPRRVRTVHGPSDSDASKDLAL